MDVNYPLWGPPSPAVSPILGTTPDPLVKTIHYRFVDPLVLDLDGDGLEITPLATGILFDANGDAIKTATAWVGAGDGLLALDRDANGSIDSGRELFGDETLLADGTKAAHGFAALSELDSGSVVNGVTVGSGDGVFDARDAAYNAVRVWTDANQDGLSQAAELQTLGEAGVTAITLASTAPNTNYGDAVLVRSGGFTRADGSSGQAGSFILAQNNFVREFAPIAPSEAAQALPDIGGSGWLRDLQEAATLDPQLIGLVQQAGTAATRVDFREAVKALLLAWSAGSGYSGASAQARADGYGLILSNPLDDQERGWMDMAIKASALDRTAFRATLEAGDLAKFDAMRERMVGDLEKFETYEAFTGHTFLDWAQIEGDAFNYAPRYTPNGNSPVTVWVPFTQLIYENRNAVPSSQEGYVLLTVPIPLGAVSHIETLWNRLVDDATHNLLSVLRLPQYLNQVELVIDDAGVQFNFTQLNASLATVAAENPREAASVVLDLYNVHGAMLDGMGWNGQAQVRAWMQQAATDPAIREAFADTGWNFLGASATAGTEGKDAFGGDANGNAFGAGAGDDLVDGLGGNDNLSGGAGDDLVYGGEGSDLLQGNDGADTLDGGAGNDIVAGGIYDTWNGRYTGTGADTYLFGRGDGQDVIYDNDATAGVVDTILFKAGVVPGDVQVSRSGDHLLLSIIGSTDQIRVHNYFASDATSGWTIEEIRFTDDPSTVWSIGAVKALALTGTAGNDSLQGYATDDNLTGNAGNDTLYGRAGNDVLDGGEGADLLNGETGNDTLEGGADGDVLQGGDGDDVLDCGAGNDIVAGGIYDTWNGRYTGTGGDTYLFGRGDGQDTIYDNDATAGVVDKINFKTGILPADVLLNRAGDDLYLKIAGTADQIRVMNYFGSDASSGWTIEEIRFADDLATVWSVGSVKAQLLNGTTGNDTLQGYATDDTITGNAGNDTIYGRSGNDVLDGGAGADLLYGEVGNDTLDGGADGDILQGGDGDDVLDCGAGNDIVAGGIYDTWNGRYTGTGADTYLFGRGDGQDVIYDNDATAGVVDTILFKAGILPADVLLNRAGDDLYLKIAGTADQIRVMNYFASDATSGWLMEEIRFTDSPFTVWTLSTVNAMTFTGGPGNDTLTGYATDDNLTGNAGNDTLYGRAGNDLLDGGSGADLLYGEAGNDALFGGADGDVLQGGAGDDVLDSGVGNDIVAGGIYDTWNGYYTGTGADTYLFGRGDGQDAIYDNDATAGVVDKIVFKAGVLPADVQIGRSGDHLLLSIIGSTDQIRVNNYFASDATSGWTIEEIRFTDDPSTVWSIGAVKALALTGTAGNDSLQGYGTDDTMTGNAGNDTVLGRAGNDLLDGGAGADLLYGEVGNDTLNGGADGDILQGMTGDDVIDGSTGNDILAGGIYDTWNGYYTGTGADTYLFGRGDGQDAIYDNDATAGVIDKIVFKNGVAPTDVQVSRSGDHLILVIIGTADQVRVNNYFASDAASGWLIEEIRFTDSASTVWSVADVKLMALVGTVGGEALQGYATNDTMTGNAGNDTLYGRAGNDVLDGGPGADLLYGEAGNDTLNGGADGDILQGADGDDVLDGGGSNDILAGGIYDTWNGRYTGTGADTYLFGRGDGQDAIYDNDATAGVVDRIVFKTGVAPGNVQLVRSGNNLLVKIAGTTDQVTVVNYFVGEGTGGWAIEEMRFTDSPSTVWDFATIRAIALGLPLGADKTVTGTEDTSCILSAADFGFSSTNAANSFGGVRIDSLPLAGSLKLAGASVTAGQVIDAAELSAGSLVYTPAGNANGDGHAAFSFSVKDQTGVFDTVPNTLTFNVAPVNDAPVLSGAIANLAAGSEDMTITIAQADLLAGFTDAESDVLSVTGLTANNGTLSAFDAATGTWTFTPAANFNGTVLLEYGVSDGAATVAATQGFTVVAVNDAPAGSVTIGGTPTQNETLTALATLTDVDGLGAISYQWKADGVDIAGATASTLILSQAQVGKIISVAASYTDGQGTAESVTSTPTAMVASALPAFVGTSGNNTLTGTAGADLMTGLAGNDTYVVNDAGDIVVEAFNGGTDLVQSSINYTLTANVENLSLTGSAALSGTGNVLANKLTGNTADNTLDGREGADTLIGGAGNDTYYVDNTADVTTEAASAGTDTVISSISWTLGGNVENLVLAGAASINATGNTLANVLTGNGGDNVLDGGSGADTMIGGSGNDTYVVGVATDVVTEGSAEGIDLVRSSVTYTLCANVEGLVLTGAGAINGTGNELANALTGNAGANRLDGGAGADTLSGGAGNDVYVVDASDVVIEADGEGVDSVESALSYTLGAFLEKLVLTGTSAIDGVGNGLGNTLTGNASDNVLDGGAGADTMVGGLGNDTYCVDNTADVTTEAASAGTDTVISTITWKLGTNLENLTLAGTANIDATGNTVANVLTGNYGNNVLSGGAGADSMAGGLGDDTYVVDVATDVVTEGANAGTDLVQSAVTYTLGANLENLTLTGTGAIHGTGNTLDNLLTGNSGKNVLNGGEGNDTLAGGLGNDTLDGGSGTDLIVFSTALGSTNVDTVQNYSVADDSIQLQRATFTALPGTGSGPLDAAAFWTGTTAHDADDRIIFDSATGKLWYDVDGNGATAAVQFAVLVGVVGTLTAADFVMA